MHEPCISNDVVTSSCPDVNWAIQVILVLLYARGIFVKFNLPMPIPKSLLNSVVMIILSMSSIIVLFTSHWTPVIVRVRVKQTRTVLPCGVVTRSSGSILTVTKKQTKRVAYVMGSTHFVIPIIIHKLFLKFNLRRIIFLL